MKKENNLILYVLVAVAILLGTVGAFKPGTVIEKVVDTDGKVLSVGAAAGPEHTQRQFFKNGYEFRCDRYATSSTASTYTMVKTEIDYDNCYLDWTPNVSTTLTTMASTSEPFLSMKVGDTREFWIRNASTTAAATITIAAGTGVDLQKNEDTADLAINGLDIARFTAMKKNDTDIILMMEEFIEAD